MNQSNLYLVAKNNLRIFFTYTMITFGLTLVISRFISLFNYGGNGWAVGEWLINYSGGFVRRGLIGQIFTSLSLKGNFLLAAIISFQIVMLSLIWIYFISKLHFYKFSWTSILIVLHPCGLLMISWDEYLYVRKELLGLSAIILLAISLKKYHYSNLILFSSIFLFVFAIFSSEVNIFLGPIFIFVILRNRTKLRPVTCYISVSTLIISLSLAIFTSIFFSGTSNQSVEICKKIKLVSLDPDINCNGAVGMIGKSLSYSISRLGDNSSVNIFYLVILIVAIIPFLFTAWARSEFWFIFTTVLSILPLFIIAWDYGRWIFIIVVVLTIFYHEENNNFNRNIYRPKYIMVFIIFFGIGHTNNLFTNGWIAAFPSILRFIEKINS
jgi:hypothetical protein